MGQILRAGSHVGGLQDADTISQFAGILQRLERQRRANAFATRFFGRNFVVLLSDVVDAMEAQPDGINFYIGHEIGHLKRQHLRWSALLAPASFVPLLGAAYARAREYTCDRHGFHACEAASASRAGWRSACTCSAF